MKLSGYICAANVVKFDYCLELAARSLMPVVDELILCDRGSTDGTAEIMRMLATDHPCVKIVNHPDPIPTDTPDIGWMVKWMNWTRLHCSHPMQIYLDADEVLSDSINCQAGIREALSDSPRKGARTFTRLNFWKDGHHLAPNGMVCGIDVTRMGPSSLYMPSDEPEPLDKSIMKISRIDRRLEIYHLGFLRKTQAFWDKSRVVQNAFFGTWDPRLGEAEAQGKELGEFEFGYNDKLQPYSGYIPEAVKAWMRERNRL